MIKLTKVQAKILNIVATMQMPEESTMLLLNSTFPDGVLVEPPEQPELIVPTPSMPPPAPIATESRQGAGTGGSPNRRFPQADILQLLRNNKCRNVTTVAAAVKIYYPKVGYKSDADLLAKIKKDITNWDEAGVIGGSASNLVRSFLEDENKHISGAAFVAYAFGKINDSKWSLNWLKAYFERNAQHIAELYAKSSVTKIQGRVASALAQCSTQSTAEPTLELEALAVSNFRSKKKAAQSPPEK